MNTRSIKRSSTVTRAVTVYKRSINYPQMLCSLFVCFYDIREFSARREEIRLHRTAAPPNIATWSKKAGETVATTIAAVELIKTPQPQQPNENINMSVAGRGLFTEWYAPCNTHTTTRTERSRTCRTRVQNRRLRMRVLTAQSDVVHKIRGLSSVLRVHTHKHTEITLYEILLFIH